MKVNCMNIEKKDNYGDAYFYKCFDPENPMLLYLYTGSSTLCIPRDSHSRSHRPSSHKGSHTGPHRTHPHLYITQGISMSNHVFHITTTIIEYIVFPMFQHGCDLKKHFCGSFTCTGKLFCISQL